MSGYNAVLARNTADAPQGIGPYSQTVAFSHYNNFSAQLPIDPATGELVYWRSERAGRAGLQEHQGDPREHRPCAGRCRQDHGIPHRYLDAAAVDEAFVTFFPSYVPTRTTVGVAALPWVPWCKSKHSYPTAKARFRTHRRQATSSRWQGTPTKHRRVLCPLRPSPSRTTTISPRSCPLIRRRANLLRRRVRTGRAGLQEHQGDSREHRPCAGRCRQDHDLRHEPRGHRCRQGCLHEFLPRLRARTDDGGGGGLAPLTPWCRLKRSSSGTGRRHTPQPPEDAAATS